MPRYFFDVLDDHAGNLRDTKGIDCVDVIAAKMEARRAIGELAKDLFAHDGDERTVAVKVRDTEDVSVASAMLRFECTPKD